MLARLLRTSFLLVAFTEPLDRGLNGLMFVANGFSGRPPLALENNDSISLEERCGCLDSILTGQRKGKIPKVKFHKIQFGIRRTP